MSLCVYILVLMTRGELMAGHHRQGGWFYMQQPHVRYAKGLTATPGVINRKRENNGSKKKIEV
jgi:hypothetical protein